MRKNKKIIWMIAIIIIIEIFTNNAILADDEDEEEINEQEIQETVLESVAKPTKEPNINARAAIIYDRETKQILWGKNENEKRAMASTTKIMSAIIVLENSNLNDIVTISNKAASIGGSRLKLRAKDKATVKDLLYGLMLRSRK